MRRTVHLFNLALAVIVTLATAVPVTVTPAATAAEPMATDYQRYITIHNDFDFPIYPVIQVSANICDGAEYTNVRRIMVNGPGNAGIPKGETLTVLIPDESVTIKVNGVQQVLRCWYRAGRIYIFPVDVPQFEAKMVEVLATNEAQVTKYDDQKHPRADVICYQGKRNAQGPRVNGNCFTGVAKATFAADVPAQLLEYTFDSDNPNANNDPDTGIPMADIDVSNVDDLYLPIAASVDNHGATGYMGSAMDLPTFKKRVHDFQALGWPVYAAYLDDNWASNSFSTLLPTELSGADGTRGLHLPGGFNSIQNTLSKSMSSQYTVGKETGYLISGVLNLDTQVQPYINRWMSWINGDPCTSLDQIIWPENITASFDKQQFCVAFRTTARAVWDHFLNDPTDGFNANKDKFYAACGLPNEGTDQNLTDACILQHIVGYNSDVLGGQLPGEVQALLRGVAYSAVDGSQQFQFDPFLTFDTPFNSQFSLDPYTSLIHSTTVGVAAVAYSFSIDDKYGNFRDASSGFIVDAGGTTVLDNKQPYDPYQQYTMNWGYNRDVFSLAWVEPGVDLATVQPQLEAIAKQFENRPILIRQADNLAVLGHAGGTNWKLTPSLVTQSQLQVLAEQEYRDSKGKTHAYQDAIDRVFGSAQVFPTDPLNVSAPQPQQIGELNFDLDLGWAAGEAVLYGFIAQQGADVPAVGNWVSATVCGVEIAMKGPGSQRLPLKFDGGAYGACAITLTDSFGNSLALSLTPALKTTTDTYTGSTVQLWGLPIGPSYSSSPPITSNLSASDLQYCQQNSSGILSGMCTDVRLSAVWANDKLARDVVYMGLDPKDMPRVNLNLPAGQKTPPDPEQPEWPANARMTTQLQNDGKVLVSWPTAVVGPHISLTNILYVFDGKQWNPQQCDQTQTSCLLTLGDTASLYVIAVYYGPTSNKQTPNLYGCYPMASTCTRGPEE
jgi:hypothetical protein